MSGPAEVLAALPAGALRALAHGLRSGNLSSASSAARLADALGVSAIAAETLRSALGAAAESGAVALAAESVLAARKDASAHQLSTLVEPVLSGPTVAGVDMRDTAVVFSTLMREARHEVLVTSFVAGFARELLVPLSEFLEADPSRRAILVLNFNGATTRRPKKTWPPGVRMSSGPSSGPVGLADRCSATTPGGSLRARRLGRPCTRKSWSSIAGRLWSPVPT